MYSDDSVGSRLGLNAQSVCLTPNLRFVLKPWGAETGQDTGLFWNRWASWMLTWALRTLRDGGGCRQLGLPCPLSLGCHSSPKSQPQMWQSQTPGGTGVLSLPRTWAQDGAHRARCGTAAHRCAQPGEFQRTTVPHRWTSFIPKHPRSSWSRNSCKSQVWWPPFVQRHSSVSHQGAEGKDTGHFLLCKGS